MFHKPGMNYKALSLDAQYIFIYFSFCSYASPVTAGVWMPMEEPKESVFTGNIFQLDFYFVC